MTTNGSEVRRLRDPKEACGGRDHRVEKTFSPASPSGRILSSPFQLHVAAFNILITCFQGQFIGFQKFLLSLSLELPEFISLRLIRPPSECGM